ncbi:MAG: RodZ domain-containing protein [Acidiferrobacter sp.]
MGNEGQVGPISAGARLQAAREAVGWTREQVALKLRLSLPQVTALETGEHASLPPAAYVRGYLRSYAQLLGLDPREFTITVMPTMPPRPTAPRTVPAGRWMPVVWGPVLYGLLLVVVGLLGFWWHSRHQSAPPVAARHLPSRRSVNAGLPPRLISLARPGTTSGQLSRFPLATAQRRRPRPVAPVRLSPRRRRVSGVRRVRKPTPAPAGAAPTVIVAAPAASTPRIPTAPLVALAPPPAADTVPNPGGLISLPQGRQYSTLTIAATTGRCWISVHDAGGQQLAFRLIHRGQALRLVGVAPFRVSFGKPQGIRVDINGHPVPLPPARKGQVLRMTVRSQPG